MTIQGDSFIHELGAAGRIAPFFTENVNASSYDMTLADVLGIQYPYFTEPVEVPFVEHYLVPGAFVIARSQEYFKFPGSLSGMVKDKSTLGRSGITCCNGGAGWFDPGFEGYAVLEIKNNHPLNRFKLVPGMPIGQMVFMQTMHVEVQYSGNYQHQKGLALDSLKSAVEKLYVKAKKFYPILPGPSPLSDFSPSDFTVTELSKEILSDPVIKSAMERLKNL